MNAKKKKGTTWFWFGAAWVVCAVLAFGAGAFAWSRARLEYDARAAVSAADLVETAPRQVEHLKMPQPLKAIYMTSFVASNKARRNALVALAGETEINAVVIDIKDYSGTISFLVDGSLFASVGAAENRIPDIREFLKELHQKGI